MRWALTMIFEEAAWRKISVSLTVGTAPEPKRRGGRAADPTDGGAATPATAAPLPDAGPSC